MKVTANVMAYLLKVRVSEIIQAVREGKPVRGIELPEARKHINDSTIYFSYEDVMKFIRKHNITQTNRPELKKTRREKINEKKMKKDLL